MARVGIVIMMGAIIISMAVGWYTYIQYQPKFIQVSEGEPVVVGPIEYVITFEGTHNGNENTRPENTFVKIRINAKNISAEKARISVEQFFFIDENGQKHQPSYGEFSEEDLLNHVLEPSRSESWTTQFDVPFDEEKKYSIAIRPIKQHETMNTAIVCLTNC